MRGHRGGALEPLWSDPDNLLGTDADDLQDRHREGPSLDATRLGIAVSAPDLNTLPPRWPSFQPAALRTRVRAVIATPVTLGAAAIGVLAGYRTASGVFSREDKGHFGGFALVAGQLLLQTSRRGAEAEEGPHRAEVHQATGVLAVQLGLPLGQAFAVLRAHAREHDRSLLAVAEDVVAHRVFLRAP